MPGHPVCKDRGVPDMSLKSSIDRCEFFLVYEIWSARWLLAKSDVRGPVVDR